MERSSHAHRALALLHKQGFLRTRDLDTIGAPRVVLTRLFTSGQLERVGRGLYRLPGNPMSEHEDLATIAVKVPKAVFCLLTALQFHELTTQLPRQVWIAMPRGSHTPRIEHPPIKMVQMAGDAYALGIDEHERDGARLRIYSAAKTVADCFKHRNQIGLDVAIEALKAAWKTRKASADDL
ncbi:type IV toxin-antitoxin system AbiEi family antitoxin domain-containing protein [Ramlibacter sp. H39-3-26]|uniref:type IV toxin-antitoxin system AbiEi family antitoxin domain-containing protein n=1 Tax=Curvibacter soli TaxID=3031331 RepID=UPI0023DC5221|nr:type IV toxin-antitoxin system AbiEi family antitoxin domain-containing protein [Ramlibacter sp. H39-3-26]MDF1485543.1 type IV toxin-antitoxin system AbiEi family antitoxin domain-containing protein [Ramlibacter sp. H39-3-26]